MEIALLLLICVLIIGAIYLQLKFGRKADHSSPQIEHKMLELQSSLVKIESNLKEDFRINRAEHAVLSKDNRMELNDTLKSFKMELGETLKSITDQSQQALRDINSTLATKTDELRKEQAVLTKSTLQQLEIISVKVEQKLTTLNEQAKADNNQMRDALGSAFKNFQEAFDRSVNSFNDVQKEKFGQLEQKQNELINHTETKLDLIRATVEEKLEKTLSERLGQSFETVGKQLIEVQKGLGEMQTIATDVGGLKKVLSNVKLRGGVGEVQLAMLLEQMLAPNQYDANVRTKAGSNDPVEFAIKMPGRNEDDQSFVYLPIDAKFPKDAYEHLLHAYDIGMPDEIETATKNMEATIRKMAKDIRDKYIDPPNTTDFAIMFLPFESIYAEVIRRSTLVDQLRDEFKISVAGPTTLMAILNSLQMGFRTLALQKRSSEVWEVLGSVKTEFEKFGGLLEKAQKNIQIGLGQLDDVVGTRTRAIKRQLKNVEAQPAVAAPKSLPEILLDVSDDDLDLI